MGLIRSPYDDPVLTGFAAEVGSEEPVVVKGGGTHWSIGGPPDPAAREVTAPSGVVAVRAEEMTVEVRAGTTVAELHSELADRGQRTTLPDAAGSTVGGVIAVGWSGMERLGRGRVRDSVLQIHYVSAEGNLITAGGPTVKNVSGFDMCRLMVGSLGTLGCMADMILRTRPIPEVEIWHRLDRADPFEIHRRCATSASILWDGASVWVLSSGHAADVDHDLAILHRLGSPSEEQPPALPAHRWSRRPADLAALQAGDHDTGEWVAEVGVGLVHCEKAMPRAPRPAGVVALEQRVKSALDPTGRFNPGRRVGDL